MAAAVTIGSSLTHWLSRRNELKMGRTLWRLLLVGVVAARLAFVYQYRAGYFASPLDILDIRDGGWDPQIGVMATWFYAMAIFSKAPAMRKPLLTGLAGMTCVYAAGTIALEFATLDKAKLSAAAVSTFDGKTASLIDFQGKPSVINLWATWCAPCQAELPLLQEAQAQHPEIHFVFLNQGESAEKVRAFLGLRNLHLKNVLLDLKGQSSLEYGSGALPTTLLFDTRGKLVSSHIGQLSNGSLTKMLGQLAK